MSLDGGLEELPECFSALASLASNSAKRFSSRSIFLDKRSQFGQGCFRGLAIMAKSYRVAVLEKWLSYISSRAGNACTTSCERTPSLLLDTTTLHLPSPPVNGYVG